MFAVRCRNTVYAVEDVDGTSSRLISKAAPPVEESTSLPEILPPSLGGGAGIGIAMGLMVLIIRGSARDFVMGNRLALLVDFRKSGCGI